MEKLVELHRGDFTFKKSLEEALLTKLGTQESVKICESPGQLPCKHNSRCYIHEALGMLFFLRSRSTRPNRAK